jgi:GT2 family glycosyltransferase
MIPVLIPWRPDNGRRDRLWDYLRDTYWSSLPGFTPIIGESPDGPFNRSAAINDAAGRAGNWNVAVIADNDTWVPPANLAKAVALTRESGRLSAAFTCVIELAEDYTDKLLAGVATADDLHVDKVRTDPLCVQSSMLVVPRELWDAVGGFDARFKGYAGEDNAFWLACKILGGEPERVAGSAFHLWHQPASRSGADYRSNVALWRRYQACRTSADLKRIRPY